MSDADDVLADRLGEAAAHEHAAGYFGDLIEDKLQGTLDGVDVTQYLPDNTDRTHFTQYTGMIDDMGRHADDHVPDANYRHLLPEGNVSPEYALAAGYVMEKQAKEHADAAVAAARDTDEYDVFIPEIRAIGRDELQELRDIEELLGDQFGWTDDDFQDMASVADVAAYQD